MGETTVPDEVSFEGLFLLDRQITSTSHDFNASKNDKPGRAVDRYHIESSAAHFTPSAHEGVCLRIHLNGDKIQVHEPASFVVKVTFADISGDINDNKTVFPEVNHVWEGETGSLPIIPPNSRGPHFLGGYSDDGAHFSFLFRLAPSGDGVFAFGGLQLRFKQKATRGLTIFRFVEGYIEISKLTEAQTDPGPLSHQVAGKTWYHRNEVVKEIVSSELSYISGLTTLIEVYKRPLAGSAISMRPMVTPEEVELLFSSVELLLNVNKELLMQLDKKVSEWTATQLIGDVFLTMAPYLKCYTQYCNNYPAATALYNRKKSTNSKFGRFIKDAKAMSNNLEMSAFLLLPVQRIPRYRMLLEDLVRHTWDSHPDFENLQKAVRLVTEITEYINNGIAKADNANKMLELQKRFIGKMDEDLIQPTRWFVQEGELIKVTGGQMNMRFFILFSDAIVYAKLRGKKQLIWKGKWDLASSWIRDLPNTPKLNHAFQMVTTKKTYVLVAKTEDIKRTWIENINAQIDQLLRLNPRLFNSERAKLQVERRGIFGIFTKQVAVDDLAPSSPDLSKPRETRPKSEEDPADKKQSDTEDSDEESKVSPRQSDSNAMSQVSKWQAKRLTVLDLEHEFSSPETLPPSILDAEPSSPLPSGPRPAKPTSAVPRVAPPLPGPRKRLTSKAEDENAQLGEESMLELKELLNNNRQSFNMRETLPSLNDLQNMTPPTKNNILPAQDTGTSSALNNNNNNNNGGIVEAGESAFTSYSIFTEPLRVYLADRSYKVFQVSHTSTAAQLLTVVLEKNFIPQADHSYYRLFEVEQGGEKRQVKETELPLAIKLGWGSSGVMEFHALKTKTPMGGPPLPASSSPAARTASPSMMRLNQVIRPPSEPPPPELIQEQKQKVEN